MFENCSRGRGGSREVSKVFIETSFGSQLTLSSDNLVSSEKSLCLPLYLSGHAQNKLVWGVRLHADAANKQTKNNHASLQTVPKFKFWRDESVLEMHGR